MRIRKKTYNTLILREKYPPLFHCSRISYNTHGSVPSTLPNAEKTCVGRVSFFIIFTLILSAFLTGCEKEPSSVPNDDGTSQYNEQDWSWDDSSKII